MITDGKQIQMQISPELQRLMDDVLSQDSMGRILEFANEMDYQEIRDKPFPANARACFMGNGRFIIFINKWNPSKMTREDGLAIAHELGHLWLSLHDFPREGKYESQDGQKIFETLAGPLVEVMEHAIFYPWLKNNYRIDLYELGKKRLVAFIRDDLPNRKIKSEADQVMLMLNYIKFKVETDDYYWQQRLDKSYSNSQFKDLKEMALRILPIIEELTNNAPNANDFIEKYRSILNIMNIKREIWPKFAEES